MVEAEIGDIWHGDGGYVCAYSPHGKNYPNFVYGRENEVGSDYKPLHGAVIGKFNDVDCGFMYAINTCDHRTFIVTCNSMYNEPFRGWIEKRQSFYSFYPEGYGNKLTIGDVGYWKCYNRICSTHHAGTMFVGWKYGYVPEKQYVSGKIIGVIACDVNRYVYVIYTEEKEVLIIGGFAIEPEV